MRIGIDTGGTFTDFVLLFGKTMIVHKVLSTPKDPSIAIKNGLIDLLGKGLENLEIYHGTTVATNALLERKGSKTVLITTKGFEDVIEIGRQNREELYNVFVKKTKPLVDRRCRIGVDERIDYKGKIIQTIDKNEISKLIHKIKKTNPKSIAVCLLNSYINPKHEKTIEKALRKLSIPLTLSSSLISEFREYERTSTTVINSYLINKVKDYMVNLDKRIKGSNISVLQSNGGLLTTSEASGEPARILLSGPSGGVIGGYKLGVKIGIEKIVTYDMGGTSTDVSLCDGSIKFTNSNKVGNLPVNIPMIDVHSIGAGGGSIAYIDSGDVLKVGPESAGSDPGPSCYGKGDLPTITDANVVLGRIKTDFFLGGSMKISVNRSKSALKILSKRLNTEVLELAEGIIDIANSNMEKALRVISLERGYDPREFSLLAFGGAGGLHACDLAETLEMKNVIFPRNPGVISAMGMLVADYFKDYSKSVFLNSNDQIYDRLNHMFNKLEKRATSDYKGQNISFEYYMDARYKRQSHELIIPFSKSFINTFHKEHKRKYGYSKKSNTVEIVNIRLRMIKKNPGIKLPRLSKEVSEIKTEKVDLFYKNKYHKARIYERDNFYSGYKFRGPAVILEPTSTLFIPPKFNCHVDYYGNILASC